jgi:hypothetical protein
LDVDEGVADQGARDTTHQDRDERQDSSQRRRKSGEGSFGHHADIVGSHPWIRTVVGLSW